MKRVVNGKRYDTETAEEICSWSHGQGKGDFEWSETSLYRTPKGAWFISGEGGPMSLWRHYVQAGGCWGSGSGLTPLDKDEARQYLELYGTPEQCATYFAVEDA